MIREPREVKGPSFWDKVLGWLTLGLFWILLCGLVVGFYLLDKWRWSCG